MKYYPEGTSNATVAHFDTVSQIKQAINGKEIFDSQGFP